MEYSYSAAHFVTLAMRLGQKDTSESELVGDTGSKVFNTMHFVPGFVFLPASDPIQALLDRLQPYGVRIIEPLAQRAFVPFVVR